MNQSKIDNFYKIIKGSGEFDEEYYLNSYPEVRNENIDPIIHYITKGAKKLYNPSILFNTDFYIYHHKDIRKRLRKDTFENFNPLVHYIQYGKNERRLTRRPNGLFDVSGKDFINNSELIANKFNFFEQEMDNVLSQLDSINELINILYSNFDVKAKGILRLEQLLALELLKLFDNFCKENDLKYWLDSGTLLGAVRHGGYIPWDDDLDIVMLRSDFEKFLKIFPEEISKNEYLKENIKINYHNFDENWKPNSEFLLLFAQVIFIKPQAKFDVFIYDNIKNKDNLRQYYISNKSRFISEVRKRSCTVKEGLNKYNMILGVSDKETDYVISAIDSYPSYRMFKNKDVFPLGNIEFEDYIFPCPNNRDVYLKECYGSDYMDIPPVITYHERVSTIEKQFNSKEEAEYYLKKAINDLRKNTMELYG